MQKFAADAEVKRGKKVFVLLILLLVFVAIFNIYDDASLYGKEIPNIEKYTDAETTIRVRLVDKTGETEYKLNDVQKIALQKLILESEFSKKESAPIGNRDEEYVIFISTAASDTKREILCIESTGYRYCYIWGHGASGLYYVENGQWEDDLMEILDVPFEERKAWVQMQEL